MLLKRPVLDAIQAGRVTLVFRKWRKLTIKTGGTLKTAIGVLSIDRIDKVRSIGEIDAKHAGYKSSAELMAELDSYPPGDIYRIALSFAGEDPRIALRENAALSDEELASLEAKLQNLGWAPGVLDIISRNPGMVSTYLAEDLGMERDVFKPRVRKLKELGLTESLDVGYRLSPRGKAVLKRLRKKAAS